VSSLAHQLFGIVNSGILLRCLFVSRAMVCQGLGGGCVGCKQFNLRHAMRLPERYSLTDTNAELEFLY